MLLNSNLGWRDLLSRTGVSHGTTCRSQVAQSWDRDLHVGLGRHKAPRHFSARYARDIMPTTPFVTDGRWYETYWLTPTYPIGRSFVFGLSAVLFAIGILVLVVHLA